MLGESANCVDELVMGIPKVNWVGLAIVDKTFIFVVTGTSFISFKTGLQIDSSRVVCIDIE